MRTLQIEILNPKAEKILQDLAAKKLISIRDIHNDGFMKIINKLRKKAKKAPLPLEEITKEVEFVRALKPHRF